MLTLQSPALKVTVLPEIGGKIGQIVDTASNHAFLIPPQKPYRTIGPGDLWIEHDTSGMDDCFPNIAAGPYPDVPWAGAPLPDLGEWVLGNWSAVECRADQVVLERGGPGVLPYRVRKVIRVADVLALELDYRVENPAAAPLRYMWAAHPLIEAGERFEVRLPDGPKTFRTFPWDGRIHSWPAFGATDLSSEWIARGENLKVFVSGLREGWCELQLPAWRLRFRFDVAVTPVVGIWYNHLSFPAGGAPFRCIALEPCTSPSDLLDDLPRECYPAIPPHGAAEWKLRLDIERV